MGGAIDEGASSRPSLRTLRLIWFSICSRRLSGDASRLSANNAVHTEDGVARLVMEDQIPCPVASDVMPPS